MNKKIWLSSPHMGGGEQKYIEEAFKENWIAPLGPNVNAFESDLQNYVGVSNAAALSSGTAAIHLALILIGVKPGDEVMCQSFTFSASANPITYCGAVPVFVDSDYETWNMNPFYLEAAIKDRLAKGKKVKAIIVVHLYGMPAKMSELMDISERYNIPIVEDAAEALGSSYQNKKLGSFGKYGVLSFNGNKIITTSGGGALLGNNAAEIEKARFLATQARDNAPHYEHTHIGYNYRMSNICAGIGRGQMEVIDERVLQRRANFNYYKKRLTAIGGFSFLEEQPGFFSNRWLSCTLVHPELAVTPVDLRLALEKSNIECRPLWKPMHLQPIFQGCPFYGDGTSELLFTKGLCLPSGSNLSQDDLGRTVETIAALF